MRNFAYKVRNRPFVYSLIYVIKFCPLAPVFVLSTTAWADNAHLLEDDWLAHDLALNSQELKDNEPDWLDYVTLKLKSDLAYSDEITLARASARLLAEGAPSDQSYAKADIQFNHLNRHDDLIENKVTPLNEEKSESNIKINDLWAQLTSGKCLAKLGRYNLFWGNVEGTSTVDVIAPMDLSEPLLTDYSLIRRAQDIAQTQCFFEAFNIQLFVIPQPYLDQYTLRQTSMLEDLESELKPEWGGRVSKTLEGLDLSVYYGRFMANTPRPIIDLTSFEPVGVYVDSYEMIGAGFVLAKDRLLFELEFSYQRELDKLSSNTVLPSQSIYHTPDKERFELAVGTEYTTSSEHQFTAGIWFFEFEQNPVLMSFKDTYLINSSWSKQFLNDDLTLSSLIFWQKDPEQSQLTLMADYLLNDYWSVSTALSYRDIQITEQLLSEKGLSSSWVSQISVLVAF